MVSLCPSLFLASLPAWIWTWRRKSAGPGPGGQAPQAVQGEPAPASGGLPRRRWEYHRLPRARRRRWRWTTA